MSKKWTKGKKESVLEVQADYSGWMMKKGHVRRNWKERFFILRGNVISYYEKPPKHEGVQPLGVIPLHKGNIAMDSERKDPLSFTIQSIQNDGEKKNFVVQTKTQEEMTKWIEVITAAAKGSEVDMTPPSAMKSSGPNAPAAPKRAETIMGSMEAVPSSTNNRDLYQMKFSFDGKLSHRNMLYEPALGNVAIQFPNGKALSSHDYIFEVRCPALNNLVEKHRNKKKRVTIIPWGEFKCNVRQPYEALVEVLPFVYLGEINLVEMTMERAIDVVAIAMCLNLKSLRYKLECWVRDHLTMENVHAALKQAHELELGDLKSLTFAFAFKSLKEFVANKAATNDLGIDLFQEVVALQTESDVQFYTVPDAPADDVVRDYKNLYISIQSDPKAGDAYVNIRGETIRFHKAILEAHSKAFKFAPLGPSAGQENLTDVIGIADDMSPDAMRTVLKFIYYGENVSNPSHATSTVTFAKRMLLHDLEKICEQRMRDMTKDNVLQLMAVTIQDVGPGESFPDIFQTAAAFVVDNVGVMNFAKAEECDRRILLAILKAWQTQVREGGSGAAGGGAAALGAEEYAGQEDAGEVEEAEGAGNTGWTEEGGHADYSQQTAMYEVTTAPAPPPAGATSPRKPPPPPRRK